MPAGIALVYLIQISVLLFLSQHTLLGRTRFAKSLREAMIYETVARPIAGMSTQWYK